MQLLATKVKENSPKLLSPRQLLNKIEKYLQKDRGDILFC